jgi:hypothetical protein
MVTRSKASLAQTHESCHCSRGPSTPHCAAGRCAHRWEGRGRALAAAARRPGELPKGHQGSHGQWTRGHARELMISGRRHLTDRHCRHGVGWSRPRLSYRPSSSAAAHLTLRAPGQRTGWDRKRQGQRAPTRDRERQGQRSQSQIAMRTSVRQARVAHRPGRALMLSKESRRCGQQRADRQHAWRRAAAGERARAAPVKPGGDSVATIRCRGGGGLQHVTT